MQFLAFWLIIPISETLLDMSLTWEYCKLQNLTVAALFLCKSKKETTNTMRIFSKENIQFLTTRLLDSDEVEIERILERHNNHMAVIADANTCSNISTILHLSEKYFFETYHWLMVVMEESALNETVKIFEQANLNVNSDVKLAVHRDQTFSIFDIYNPASSHHGQLVVKFMGTYPGDNLRFNSNKYWIRKNMTGVQFKSAIVVPNPQISLDEYLTSEENRQEFSMHRFQKVTVNYCKEFFNFTLKIIRTESWGYMQDDGHFDGLVGLLERRLIDFGSSPLIYKLDRMPVIDYSYGNWILKSTFIYRRPKITEASYEIFLRPLAGTVWICIVIMMLIKMMVLKIMFSREKRIIKQRRDRVDPSWSFLFLFTLGAFCQQGATCYPKLLSSRTISICVFFFCILIYQFYSASIVSYLLMDSPRKINNLKDLLDSNLRVGIEDILIDRNYFVQTTDPAAIELYDKKIKGPTNDSGFYHPSAGLEMVKNGGFAYHVETSTAYPIVESTFTNQEICELEEIQMYRTQPMHTNLQKNSPFREMLNYCMLRLVEDGNMYRLRRYWDARKPVCIESAKKIEIHVGIPEFSCGLIVLSYGICLSLLFLVIEIMEDKKDKLRGCFDKMLKRRQYMPNAAYQKRSHHTHNAPAI